ncbi:hypothetical protein ACLEEB_14570 [Lonsdalea quercina]|uniref:DUF7167 family protein n=1 Tax=Lonsdalea quercina TaxID=71657 RepID=UPI003975C94F
MYKFKVFCDSGANCQSKYEVEVTTDELGITESEWDALSEHEQEEVMKEVAFERLDWGYCKVE